MRTLRLVVGAVALVGALAAAPLSMMVSPVHAQHARATVKKIVTTEANNHYIFKAKKVTISAGTKVTWSNISDAPHTVTFKTGGHFDKMLATSAKLSRTFTKAGTYKYYCKYHTGMVGTIVVK